jgi:hypothetical protein
MNQADKDHEQWLKKNQETQYREWIKATETGTPYYINQHGDVVIEKEKTTND